MTGLILRLPIFVTLIFLSGAAMLVPAIHASVIDQDGIIRGKDLRDEEAEKAIESLLAKPKRVGEAPRK